MLCLGIFFVLINNILACKKQRRRSPSISDDYDSDDDKNNEGRVGLFISYMFIKPTLIKYAINFDNMPVFETKPKTIQA